MNCAHCSERLQDLVDGDCAPGERTALELHLAGCPTCRAQYEALQDLLNAAQELPRAIAPRRDLWNEIEAQISSANSGGSVRDERRETLPKRAGSHPALGTLLRWGAPLAAAASIAVFASLAEQGLLRRTPGWSVAAVAGSPRVGSHTLRDEGTLRIGQWLETDASSRARVTVGAIGEVNVEPNSRLRLVATAATEHRLALARGGLNAFILAPPRLFVVDTPSARAVDLGCAYTLHVDEAGNGELHVTSGYVALEHAGRESIIPIGMMCFTRRGHGPGTPFAEDAPQDLRVALTRFDFEPGVAAAMLPRILEHARPADAVTLWHLLSRTTGASRGTVFDVLARHAPPPAAVTRDGILAGSPAMLRAWAAELGLDRF